MLGYIAYAFSTLAAGLLSLLSAEGGRKPVLRAGFLWGRYHTQPSELVKVTFILMVALYLNRIFDHLYREIQLPETGFLCRNTGWILELLQPDIGTSLGLCASFLICMGPFCWNTVQGSIFAAAGGELLIACGLHLGLYMSGFPFLCLIVLVSFLTRMPILWGRTTR